MKSITASLVFCLLLSVAPVTAATYEQNNFLPKTVSPEKLITRIEAIRTVNSMMTWWEDYNIEIETNFWAKLWLQVKKFFSYLTLDIENLAKITKSPYSDDIFVARRWGYDFDEKKVDTKINGWQLLDLESQALTSALRYRGFDRGVDEEIAGIRKELEGIDKNLKASYKEVISSNLISKPQTAFVPDDAWVYFIFARQHDLLPQTNIKTPQEMLNINLDGKGLKNFTDKFASLLKQMAEDLKSGE